MNNKKEKCNFCKKEFNKEYYNQQFCNDDCKKEYFNTQILIRTPLKGVNPLKSKPLKNTNPLLKISRKHDITEEQYKKLKEKCSVCDWTYNIHIHHWKKISDGGNHDLKNLVGLCPNHHALVHMKKFKLIKINDEFKIIKINS